MKTKIVERVNKELVEFGMDPISEKEECLGRIKYCEFKIYGIW